MGLNDTPAGERVHIGFFGRRNAGKSSLLNAVTNQDLAVVSDTKGTTTDPVYKSMELLPLGPVMMIDTPGFDDEGTLGEQRIRKTKQVLNKSDVAVLVTDAAAGLAGCEKQLIGIFKEKEIPYIIALNKCDLLKDRPQPAENAMYVSAATKEGIEALKERIGHLTRTDDMTKKLVGDLLKPGDVAVLVTPIDSAAPKGRMILPQQQMIRDVLEADAVNVVVKENALQQALQALTQKPAMVITDSQAFHKVAAIVPQDIPLTSFSILMARYKGLLPDAVKGAAAIDRLQDGDTVLIAEGCTHHRQCSDIGTVKLPRWLHNFTGKELKIATSSGTGFPEDLSPYALVLHCGGCMLNAREIRYRMKCAADQQVPVTNYGVAIAYMNGILRRSLSLFPDLLALLDSEKGRAE
ncbi:MAG: [FeFe] hydrogenase H-cluster maturation GTPase HydF [Oscillospiraceae bacterium]|nr:[FeFe] hydrogenase H-cluster maturation GTPase HydF [Oscillospiraceae bacterium]